MEEERPLVQSRTVLVVAGVVVAIVVVATVVTLAVRSPADLEPGSPEAAAQGYVQAVIDGDESHAVSYLAPQLQGDCSVSELRNAYVPESVRVRLAGTSLEGDVAEVDLAIEEGVDGLGGGYEVEVTLVMERHDGSWVISEPPWPMEYCGEVGG